MESRRFCKWRKWASGSVAALLLSLLAGGVAPAQAGAPDWLKALAREAVPTFDEDVDMVILLDEQVTTVKENGEITTRYRRAFKILRPSGREHGTVAVYFDNETRLTYLKAWSLPRDGKEFEVKEKDAVETSFFGSTFYEDTRHKLLDIPAADPGNTIGYEYEQRRRPYILQDGWVFQDTHPLRRGRYVLELPEGWEFDAAWINYPEQEPQQAGKNVWVWQLQEIPEIDTEPAMPPWQAVAGRLIVNLYPTGQRHRGIAHRSWQDLGKWSYGLSAGRRTSTPEIHQKVQQLTQGRPTTLEKIRALAGFVQRDIRYVAIEIGIGGWQPHPAADIFSNRYGDCKDKANLLGTMLAEIGVDSYNVNIHTRRGVVGPSHPPALTFNHRILAIRLPPDVSLERLYAVGEHERLGRLLFFDPTDDITPLGQLPASLQSNFGLVVTEEGGELVQLPLLPPSTSRLLRTATLKLAETGSLSGEVQEVRWGVPAVERRADWLGQPEAERKKVLEQFLGLFLASGFTLQSAAVENLEKLDDNLVVRYSFRAPNYAQLAGNLLLVRPRVLGGKGSSILERKDKPGQTRVHPVELGSPELHSDVYEIELPSGYLVDEVPPPVEVEYDFASYKSKVEVEGNRLRYQREYVVKDVRVPTERLNELKEFYRRIAADERASVVLKRAAP
ncbi:MAG: DUF3857 domain-containing transglutaminase family protein [Candidatus Acidiferrales bacterium]